jgi:hypothetical protein
MGFWRDQMDQWESNYQRLDAEARYRSQNIDKIRQEEEAERQRNAPKEEVK